MDVASVGLPGGRLVLQLVLVHVHELTSLAFFQLLLDNFLCLLCIDDCLLLALLLELKLSVLGDLRLYFLPTFDFLTLTGR